VCLLFLFLFKSDETPSGGGAYHCASPVANRMTFIHSRFTQRYGPLSSESRDSRGANGGRSDAC
jgi:hypothetical protein